MLVTCLELISATLLAESKAFKKHYECKYHPSVHFIELAINQILMTRALFFTLRSLLNKQAELSKQGGIFVKNS